MRRLLVLLALAIVVVLAGARGSPEDENSSAKRAPKEVTAVETVQVAYEETAAERTAKTSFEVTAAGVPTDPGNGVRAKPMALTMTGHGVVDFTGAASSVTMEMLGMGNLEVRQIEDRVYTRMPDEFLAQVPDAEPWIEADLQEMYGQGAWVREAQEEMVEQIGTSKLPVGA
jgi:hypothetical protein